jgi:nicotinate dehydrogenase subunit B
MTSNTRKDERPRSGQPDGRPERPPTDYAAEGPSHVIGDWLQFESDGSVVVMVGKAEVGQGIRTSLALAVAEELRMPAERVRVLMADTHVTPYDMGTFGSRTTPYTAPVLHKAAAAARRLFTERAAALWAVDPSELTVSNGSINHPPTGRSTSYAGLISGAESGRLDQLWSDDEAITPPESWTTAGRPALRASGRDFVTGKHRYTTDMARPGMLISAVLRPPSIGATLVSLNGSAAEALPGVTVVRTEKFAGVVAPDRATARRALALLRPTWNMAGAGTQVSSGNVFDFLKSHPAAPQAHNRWAGADVFEEGSLTEGMAAASGGHAFEASYRVAYIAHAPLETRAAIAEWNNDELTVWTGTQRPFGVRSELAAAFEKPEEQVRVIVPDTGSAYGGKHTGDAAIEAAWLALAVGHPVKLTWSREEEFTSAYFRPAGLIEVRSAIDAGGRITAWDYHNYNSGAAGIRTPYAIPNQHIEFHTTETPLRQGSYRALAATANNFARESHMDELARLVGIDPLDFRLLNLPDVADLGQSRLRAALLAATERFGWASRPAGAQDEAGHGYGLACGTEKGSYVATCAEVHIDPANGQVRVKRVVQAFECGAIVDPEGLENQVEGAIIMGLGGALMERIDFDKGKVLTDRFSRYPVPRFRDVPAIETVLLDRKDLPSAGAGETPIIGIAPAVANAIFDATGVRLRALPLARDPEQQQS